MYSPIFTKARNTDRVWSKLHGWGSIESVEKSRIFVPFDCEDFQGWYDLYGFYFDSADLLPELFWDEIPIPPEALTPPKRTRKETKYFFAVPVYSPHGWGGYTTYGLFKSQTVCFQKMSKIENAQGPYLIQVEVQDD